MRIAMGLVVLACVVASAPVARAETKRTGVFVTLTQVPDDVERTGHIDAIRHRLAACAQLQDKHVDVNVTRLAWVTVGASVEIQLELAFVVSNTSNEIVSVANQTAKLVLAKAQFKETKLPELRREVIDNAIGDLIVKLRRASSRSV